MFHPTLGQMAGGGGKTLSTIPGTASMQDIIAGMNEIISSLNAQNQDVVLTDTVQVPRDGVDHVIPYEHHLGYKPRATAYINSAHIVVDQDYRDIDIPLPTYLAEVIPGSGGGSGNTPIAFLSWLDYFVDDEFIYIHLINPGNLNQGDTIPVTFSLFREPTTND